MLGVVASGPLVGGCGGGGRTEQGTWMKGRIRKGIVVVGQGDSQVAWRLVGCMLGRMGIKAVGASGAGGGGGSKVADQREGEAVQTKDGELLKAGCSRLLVEAKHLTVFTCGVLNNCVKSYLNFP